MKVCKGNHTLCPDPRIFSLFMHGTRARITEGMRLEDALRAEIESLNRFCEAIGCPHLKEMDDKELEGDAINTRRRPSDTSDRGDDPEKAEV